MTVDERRRYALYEAARRELGEDEATALMELLPPVGWADVATKQDLAAFDHRFDAMEQRFEAIDRRFEGVDHRFVSIAHRLDTIDARIESGFREQTNRILMWILPIVIATITVSVSVAAAV